MGTSPENGFPLFLFQSNALCGADLLQYPLRIREVPIFRGGHCPQAAGGHRLSLVEIAQVDTVFFHDDAAGAA